MVGLGDPHYSLAFCIANRPSIEPYPGLDSLRPLAPGELAHIVAHTSNHWRKLFNVYAKFLYALGADSDWPARWQDYRDERLLQAGSGQALLFSPPDFSRPAVHIVAGKIYADQLALPGLQWLNERFAVNPERRLIVSPYLDYRQLSNARIDFLAEQVTLVSR